MVRLPAGFHFPVAGRGGNKLAWRPGTSGGMLRPRRPDISLYRSVTSGVPLSGGNVQGTVPASGTVTLKIGPQGLGTIWYPQAATVSSTTGAADNSTVAIYLGAQAQGNLQGGQSYAGGGDTIGLTTPALTPGALLIAVWTGANQGDTVSLNIYGTMDALTT